MQKKKKNYKNFVDSKHRKSRPFVSGLTLMSYHQKKFLRWTKTTALSRPKAIKRLYMGMKARLVRWRFDVDNPFVFTLNVIIYIPLLCGVLVEKTYSLVNVFSKTLMQTTHDHILIRSFWSWSFNFFLFSFFFFHHVLLTHFLLIKVIISRHTTMVL